MPAGLYNRITPWLFDRLVFDSGSAEADPGNLFAPQAGLNAVEGGWRRRSGARVGRVAAVAAIAALPIAGVAVASRRGMLGAG